MKNNIELTPTQQLGHAIEAFALAMEFRATGKVDSSRWDPMAIVGLGNRLTSLASTRGLEYAKDQARLDSNEAFNMISSLATRHESTAPSYALIRIPSFSRR